MSYSAGAIKSPSGLYTEEPDNTTGLIVPLDIRDLAESAFGDTYTTQTGSYTFALTDRGTTVMYNATGAGTFTIPTNASVAFPVGTRIRFRQIGAGQLTIAGAGGVTVNTSTSLLARVQGSKGEIEQTAANVWYCDGDMQ